ncbi:conserved hypothetical protein [Pirellula staleyi DSM 6068]|uniref:Ribosomal subunit interface protein n=1 Tax=Pirellula staleyi (strain ATCC 27377 / DSM 6068 / ICPB 4128) TaxID=530564 RepID=D2R4D6_PIRSD|nr:HPF/RaiA family ribosome-associated protein [Pirellula staleyi]ADB15284.1 conserved hypothetical protein [Pirellula staleyi DSM 6068]
MRIVISNRRAAISKELYDFAERRVLFALSRFAPRIEQVLVLLTDENGPRGGIDQTCQLVIQLDRGEQFTIRQCEATVEEAVSRAADAASRMVGRSMAKRRDKARSRYVAAARNYADN